MSTWRQNGFVQDSDEEEEESQLESQSSKKSGNVQQRVERVGDAEIDNGEAAEGDGDAVILGDRLGGENGGSIPTSRTGAKEPDTAITNDLLHRRPTTSPFTPAPSFEPLRENTESPDPLQSSPSPRPHRRRQAVSSQIVGSPSFAARHTTVEPRQQDRLAAASQASSGTSHELRLPPSKNGRDENKSADVLAAFDIEAPSDDEGLSEPPSDLDSPEAGSHPVQPHRRTAVQVVIPSSTALQQQTLEQEARRQFRQRKPIQQHPYALEAELYRREVQSRGLKPVPRPRSPERRTRQDDAETQENEFDPNESPSSSPPELEIPVSTPVQRPRNGRPRASSPTRRLSVPTKLRLPATQIHPFKRRRLETPSTQLAALPRSIFDDPATPDDIWSIPPQSPPYSSSPPLNGRQSARPPRLTSGITPLPNLPTPSTSSVLQGDSRPLPDSDPDPGPLSTRRTSDEPRRTQRVILSDQSSSDSESSSEASQSDRELRKVGKKIKGVLPASWLRFDREAQERRKAQAREWERARGNATLSPPPSEPQRGVAQRVLKRTTGPGNGGRSSSLSTPAENPIVISDGSEDDGDNREYNEIREVQRSAEEANALAAALDSRYADDDLDNMENDRLHLFTLGGPKRKKQTKVTDIFNKAKRLKASDGTAKKRGIGGSSRRHTNPRKARRTPPPAMSVVDIDMSLSKPGGIGPHFLRLARRQALRRPDLARQSPESKQVHLYNVRDTADANATLEQWRGGKLKPKTSIPSRLSIIRSPLTSITDNQRCTQKPWQTAKSVGRGDQMSSARASASRTSKHSGSQAGLGIFHRTSHRSTSSQHVAKKTKSHQVLERNAYRAPLPLRSGQLEGDESVYGHGHKKIAFEQGLRNADRQTVALVYKEHSFMNPQLARFLADEDAVLPPRPSAKDIGEQAVQGPGQQTAPPRRRLVRKKIHAARIDIEAREFRQPSEPAVQDVLIGTVADHDITAVTVGDEIVLQGLGPYGTRYPTTFDVSSLQSGTYFHSSTLVGSEDLQLALSMGQPDARNLDEAAGYFPIMHDSMTIRCGPWNDETSSGLTRLCGDMIASLEDEHTLSEAEMTHKSLANLTQFLRSVIQYINGHLSFSDPIDRASFAMKMQNLIISTFTQLSVVHARNNQTGSDKVARSCVQCISNLLVLGLQTSYVATHALVDESVQHECLELIRKTAGFIIAHVVRKGIPELGDFLEQNKRHAVRENGVQSSEVLVEGFVICMHVSEGIFSHGFDLWDLVNQELSTSIIGTTNVHSLEAAWATLFTLLPFTEIDSSGIPSRDRRESFEQDNWSCISTMLRRVFELYSSTYRKHSGSLNDYVRANLARCHRLIKHWHWQRPESMLNATFDFFGKNGLKQLQGEASSGSVSFLDDPTAEQPTTLEQNECSFHVALKCLALGLNGMSRTYKEKKVRSFVFRLIPNHGRTYPKDQGLDEESLAALRNHHDLLCTLYRAAPPSCRPKLEHIRHLVSHETSHREACRVSVRAWTNLTCFQLSTNEPYTTTKPFALWHKDIMHQTLKQYRLAKVEADDYLKSGVLDGTTDVSLVMVRHAMEKNQEQVIATLRDCIAGMRKAMRFASAQTSLDSFLGDSDIVHLLELPHLEDRRLVTVIREALAMIREYANLYKKTVVQEESQQTSEESQDYGDFPDMEDLNDVAPQPAATVQQNAALDFFQTPLWHLLSNAFGAEAAPDDNLLMDCVDTWVSIADTQVVSGARSWFYYIDSFSQVSWQQLRDTEHARKFGPYFLSALAECDRTSYDDHSHEYFTALLLSLADRESMLRFQHRLLHAIIRIDRQHPLMKNLPFYHVKDSDQCDINIDTIRSRRLALISSILSNMRDELYATMYAPEVKRTYATMLTDFMTRLKNNYQQLRQGTKVTGAYVEFVQKIVQFLQQYTSDICPVSSFFTDSVAFPLPSTDPKYVVARLCGYAPKVSDLGTAKQLSVFVQTVAQQAAADNQQMYLVNQVATAICSEDAPATERAALRSVLLQGIIPEYIEQAFSSSLAFLIARPLLQALPPILEAMIFSVRVSQPESLASIVGCITATSHAFIRATEPLKTEPTLFEQPHNLCSLTLMLESMASLAPLLDYICSQASSRGCSRRPPIITYVRDFGVFVAEMLHHTVPHDLPYYSGNASASPMDKHNSNLLSFCKRGLDDSIKMNWSEDADGIWFGQGQAKRAIVSDLGSLEEEKARLVGAIGAFDRVFQEVYGDEGGVVEVEVFGGDVVV